MDEKLVRQIKFYIWRVGCHIIRDRKVRKKLKNDIYDAVYSYAEEHGVSTMQEIYDEFGTPKKVASAHLSLINPDKVLNYRKIIIGAVIALVVVVIASIFFSFVDAHYSYYSERNLDYGETAVVFDTNIMDE